MGDDEATAFRARLDAMIGEPLGGRGPSVAPDPVNQPMIRHWVAAFDDTDPVYTDPQRAAASRVGEIVAPPAMLQTWALATPVLEGIAERGGSPTELSADSPLTVFDDRGFTGTLAVSSELEIERYLHLGDVVSSETAMESISDEKRTRLGPGHFVTWVSTYTDQDGALVGRQRFRVLKFRPAAPPPAAPPPGAPPPGDGSDPVADEVRSTGAGSTDVPSTHDGDGDGDGATDERPTDDPPTDARSAELPSTHDRPDDDGQEHDGSTGGSSPGRGSGDRSGAGRAMTSVGQALPELTVTMTATRIVAGALATRDFMPVHHDQAYARAQGAPDVFMNIMSTNAWCSRYLTDWAGPDGLLRNLSLRLGVPVYPGTVVRFEGSVTGASVDGDEEVVEVAFTAATELGPHATGTAVLTLPVAR